MKHILYNIGNCDIDNFLWNMQFNRYYCTQFRISKKGLSYRYKYDEVVIQKY